ncbi:MAG: hypothetical protein M3Y59_10985 [Myxococcota bacterium]|nr:hypothetical protein [Myxococcota bacterium]
MTLIEKLDAIAARFDKNRDPSEYIRHYEDAARIIQAEAKLPPLEESLQETAKQMAPSLRLKRVAPAAHPAFNSEAPNQRGLQDAYAVIAPMFWAPRLSLDDARSVIREWLGRHFA